VSWAHRMSVRISRGGRDNVAGPCLARQPEPSTDFQFSHTCVELFTEKKTAVDVADRVDTMTIAGSRSISVERQGSVGDGKPSILVPHLGSISLPTLSTGSYSSLSPRTTVFRAFPTTNCHEFDIAPPPTNRERLSREPPPSDSSSRRIGRSRIRKRWCLTSSSQ